ncbi:MAG: NifU family protein [Anaerolineae bacterium]|nr:NifU family protein [Anaerolineae bacterium]
MPENVTNGDNADAPIEERLQNLIENLSSYIEYYHGGSCELVSFDGKVARVSLGGACDGCPLSLNTLHGWIAGTVRQFFPDIVVEEAASDS